jgi:hypothetical protein
MAVLALYFWQVSLGTFFAIMAGTAATLSMLLFLFVTVKSHHHSYISAQSRFEPVHPGRDIIPQEFWDSVLQTVDELAPFGFEVRCHLRRGEFVPGAVSFVTVLENVKERDIAKLLIAFVSKKRLTSLVLHSEFADGTELVTANNRILAHLPTPKNRIALWLPDVRDAGDLYRIHQQAARGLGIGEKVQCLDGDPVNYMEKFSKGEIARWIQLGYYRPDETGDKLWLTWKGALLMTSKRIPPVKELYEAWRKHQTNKLLRKLEE